MSTTYTHTDRDGDTLTVRPATDFSMPGGIIQTKSATGSRHYVGTHYSPEHAPAVALAILVAAGVEPDAHGGDPLSSAAATLASVINREARKAEFDAELLALVNALRRERGHAEAESVDELSPLAISEWSAVVRRARQLHAQKEAASK